MQGWVQDGQDVIEQLTNEVKIYDVSIFHLTRYLRSKAMVRHTVIYFIIANLQYEESIGSPTIGYHGNNVHYCWVV